MARVTITLEDGASGDDVLVEVAYEPELREGDEKTSAQQVATAMLAAAVQVSDGVEDAQVT